jgi:hypothetical protein
MKLAVVLVFLAATAVPPSSRHPVPDPPEGGADPGLLPDRGDPGA